MKKERYMTCCFLVGSIQRAMSSVCFDYGVPFPYYFSSQKKIGLGLFVQSFYFQQAKSFMPIFSNLRLQTKILRCKSQFLRLPLDNIIWEPQE